MRKVIFFLSSFMLLFLNMPGADAQDVAMSDSLVVSCQANFFDSGTSGAAYSPNENYTLTFQSASNCILDIVWTNFDLGAGDTLFIYDGCDLSALLIGTFTQTSLPLAIQSTGNCLTFHFTSDGAIEASGWMAEISCPTTPVANILADGPTEFCGGDSVHLIASGTGTVHWNTLSNEDTITVSFPGTYVLTITSAGGCSDTAVQEITVYPLPPVGFILDQDTFCTQDPAYPMTGGFPVGGAYSGTGVVNNTFFPSQAGQGVVTVYYTYTDSNGCSRTIPQSITVLICQGVKQFQVIPLVQLMPNPVHDNLNIEIQSSDEFEMLVVTDIHGRCIQTTSLNHLSNEFQMDVHDWIPGFYFFRFVGKNQACFKVVKTE